MGTGHLDLIAIANEQHGLVARRQLLRRGWTRRQFDRQVLGGTWIRVTLGVYRHLAAPDTWESRLLAACLTGGVMTVASHRSAAALHGLTGGSTDVVEITSHRWRRSQHPGLIAHETKAITSVDVAVISGIPVTTVERTLLDLGAVRGRVTVQMALDRALASRLTTWERVDETLQRLARSGRPGVRKLRSALHARRPNVGTPESEAETQLLELISGAGLPRPVPQYRVYDNDGDFIARVDAAYPEQRIAIEYDSDQEHTEPMALARDNVRRNRLISAGWTVLAARNDIVFNGSAAFLSAVKHVMASN